jgi:hypothetical protein
MIGDLFEYAAFARRPDPATSHAAAASIEGALPNLEAIVFASIKAAGQVGRTLDEVVEDTGLEKVTASPRFRPLADKLLIEPCGTRPGRSNRKQIAWRQRLVPSP